MSNVDATKQQTLVALCNAFNDRDIDAAVAMMTPNVTWPRAFKGGFIEGPCEIRKYWSEQWSEIDPRVEPIGFQNTAAGVLVTVHQIVKSLAGEVLNDSQVEHIFEFEGDKVKSMSLGAEPD